MPQSDGARGCAERAAPKPLRRGGASRFGTRYGNINGEGGCNVDAEIVFLVVGVAISACVLGVALWGYLRSDWPVKPNPERQRQFMESAPLHLLRPVGTGEPEMPTDERSGAASDDRDSASRDDRCVAFRLFGSFSVEIGFETGPASTGCNRNQRQISESGAQRSTS